MSYVASGPPEPLEFFGANPDEIEIGPERKAVHTREVCVCGHPMAHHEILYEGLEACQESKMYCPCRYKRAVLDVDDLRAFKFATEGYGRNHALWKGLKKLKKMGKSARTLVDSTCWKCFENRPIEPVPLSPANHVSRHAEARNVMICVQCRYELEGIGPSIFLDEVPGEAVSPSEAPGTARDAEQGGHVSGTAWPQVFVQNSETDLGHQTQGPEFTTRLPEQKTEMHFQKLNEAPY